MKKKKKIILGLICILIFIISFGFSYFYFTNPNRLTSQEKRFIADNSSNVLNLHVLNNVSVFGDTGSGVFYDFINDFGKKYGLKINNVAFNLGEQASDLSLTSGNLIGDNEFVFYKSHYVLISQKNEFFASLNGLNNKNIGILNDNLAYVQSYLGDEVSFKSYPTREELLKDFKEQNAIQYMVVPLHIYLEAILSNDYYVVHHFEDIPYYFKISMGTDTLLGQVMKKYYVQWESHLEDYYLEHLFNLFVKSLNLSLTDIDTMRSVRYHYGFVENKPYEILSGGKYGGIIAQNLKEFMKFSDVDIEFLKYKTLIKFNHALNQKKFDMFFGYYDDTTNFDVIHSGIGLSYSVIGHKKDSFVVQSLKSLNNKTVYVLENSVLYNYLKDNTHALLKTYKTNKELKKIVKEKGIIVLDTNNYLASLSSFPNYSERYHGVADTDYVFKVSTNEVFNKLFLKFSNLKSPMDSIYKGSYNYDLTLRAGTITGTIARYFLYILIILVISFLYIYKVTKRVKLSKKIKKEDKLKYIDQLTSLKNRNYLNENLEGWSQNTIYPQAVVVIDLNRLQYINDTMGYEQGDEQIKGAANILVKTQLDNSDIIRTDGNEFVIYLVGYQMKQITSYIHKLTKEFKKLPYEYGAAIGYSMIEDKIKSVEDAINEAVEEVKSQKEKRDKKEGSHEK